MASSIPTWSQFVTGKIREGVFERFSGQVLVETTQDLLSLPYDARMSSLTHRALAELAIEGGSVALKKKPNMQWQKKADLEDHKKWLTALIQQIAEITGVIFQVISPNLRGKKTVYPENIATQLEKLDNSSSLGYVRFIHKIFFPGDGNLSDQSNKDYFHLEKEAKALLEKLNGIKN